MTENYEFIIKPILDKHNTFFVVKKDGRKKKKSVRIEFKINGGTVSGLFELKRLKTTTHTFDAVTGFFIPYESTIVFDDDTYINQQAKQPEVNKTKDDMLKEMLQHGYLDSPGYAE
jgi:hypothetical protein